MARDLISAARGNSLVKTNGGPALILRGSIGTAFPTRIKDILDFEGGATQFAPESGWSALGLTRGGVTISRGFEKTDRESDQSYGSIDHRITSWETSVSTELLETDLAALSLAWGGATTAEVATAVTAQNTLVTTTALTAGAGVVINVTAGDGADYAAGDILVVGVGSDAEYVVVASIVTDAITITAVLQNSHPIGTRIRKLREVSMTFGTKRLLETTMLAVIAPVIIESSDAGGVIQGLRAHVFRRAKLDGGQRQIQFSNQADWSLPLSWRCFPDMSIGDPDKDTFVVYEMKV